MGNSQSSPRGRRSSKKHHQEPATATDMAKRTLGEMSSSLQASMRKFEESSLLDQVCGTFMDEEKLRSRESYAYSEDLSEEDSRTLISEDETLDEYDRRRKSGKSRTVASESESLISEYDTQSEFSGKRKSRRGRKDESEDSESFLSEDSSFSSRKKGGKGKGVVTEATQDVGLSKPLASSFAKRCYFTKAGIGKTTQHYEGLTLNGNIVLMLAGAMKLKGCPTICDEDLRRVEQTYPNQFSRLPDELLLSSGWRRISKYCHFSNKPIPDGVPFFHSKQRMHPSGGYYFLLAAAVGMIRPAEVEPLTRDTLVLLETDYPTQCDAAPDILIEDASQWTLVDKFCFFSGGPINTEEDVYYQADFEGNLIFMLAFLSPSLTPEELYKLGPPYKDEPGLKTIASVEEVESVYDLTERDFDDLKLYHLGPCRALPPYILQPAAWTKVLPPHFLAAKQQAAMIAHEYEQSHPVVSPSADTTMAAAPSTQLHPPAEGETNAFNVESAPPAGGEQYYTPEEWSVPGGSQYSEDKAPPSYYSDEAAQSGSDEGAPPPPPHQQYSPVQQGMSNPESSNSFAYASTPSSEQGHGPSVLHSDENFQREVEEEGAFIDSNAAPDDEAIATRQQIFGHRSAHSSGGDSRENLPISPPGYMAGDVGFDPPEDEPPSLSKHDAPDDEGGYRGGYMEAAPSGSEYDEHGDVDYYNEEEPYDARPGEMRNVAAAPNGYYHDGEYYQSQDRESSEYYEREEEYYDSPENRKGLRVENAAADQHQGHEFEEPPDPDNDVIYSPGVESEFTEGFARNEDGYYESSNPHTNEPVYNLDEGGYYESPDHKRHTGDTDVSTPDVGSFESQDYASEGESPRYTMEEKRESFVPINSLSRGKKNVSPQSASDLSFTDSVSQSEYSQTSAMRGAQELLKKNRQKRLEMAMRKHTEVSSPVAEDELMSPRGNDDASAATSMASASSVWTDASGTGDRSSRRALILQMAKARMKSNKAPVTPTATIHEEPSEEELNESSRADLSESIDLVVDLD